MNSFKAARTGYLGFPRISLGRNWNLIWAAVQAAFKHLPLIRRRVPVALQMNAVECGSACLAMILSYFGRKTQTAECRDRLSIGRDGVTALAIATAARSYGLQVQAFSLELSDFNLVPLPAIVFWNFNHFVVVERWSPKAVDIIDPADGRRRLTPEEFDAGFTGVALTFEPGNLFRRSRPKIKATWRNYLGQMLRAPGNRGLLLQIFGASLLLLALGLVLPIFTKVLVDHVLPLRITNVMPILGIGMVVLVLTQTVGGYLRAALSIYLETRLDSQLMLGFFEHVLTLPFRFFQQRTSGDLLMRLGSNAVIREMLTSQTLSVILDGVLVLVYLAILLVLAPTFGFVVLAIGVLQVLILLSTTRRVHRLAQRELAAEAESQSYLVEALSGVATLKASGAEDQALSHWSNLFFNHLSISLKRNHLAVIVGSAMTTIGTLAPLALLWIGAIYVLDGTMSLGTMLALTTLASSFLSPVASLVSSGQQLQLLKAHIDRLADVLEAEPEQDAQAVQSVPQLTGKVELRQVNFRYSADAPLVLRDISVTIEPGQKVALVGRTGSGKSTLALLLLGLYTPEEGEILYDGMRLQDLNYRMLRRQFGVVLQDPFLFSGSIRQNIAFNDPTLSLEEVMEAARATVIDNEIMQMPMTYETRIAEGGEGLSGGQRQRISLARALANKPAFILLDEATSNLDVVTERLVDQNLSDLSCTRIVTAHRLSTIVNADLILVLDEGRIVEQGTHTELLELGGHYAGLVHNQIETDAVEAVPRLPVPDIINTGLESSSLTAADRGEASLIEERRLL